NPFKKEAAKWITNEVLQSGSNDPAFFYHFIHTFNQKVIEDNEILEIFVETITKLYSRKDSTAALMQRFDLHFGGTSNHQPVITKFDEAMLKAVAFAIGKKCHGNKAAENLLISALGPHLDYLIIFRIFDALAMMGSNTALDKLEAVLQDPG